MQGLLVFGAISLSIFMLLMVGHVFARRTQVMGYRTTEVASNLVPSYTRGSKAVDKELMCPYCLSLGTIMRSLDEHSYPLFTCSNCNDKIPSEYVRDLPTPRHVVSAVHWRGHGASAYFSSLFYSLDALSESWPDFYSIAVGEESLRTVKGNVESLAEGRLPGIWPLYLFPHPTMIRFSHLPNYGDRFFLFYDTGGEAYARPSALAEHARFVAKSRVVLFLVSLDDAEYDGSSFHELLSVYVQGLSDLEENTKDQHLVVVLAQGDRLESRLSNYSKVWRYLMEGSLDQLRGSSINNYISHMKGISRQLRSLTSRKTDSRLWNIQ